jgi:Phosphoribosyl-ATP pyrophosphohydrolase
MNQTYEQMLTEFHTRYGHWIFKQHGPPPAEVKLLRLRLMAEELGELGEALSHPVRDRVLIADAIADLGYVIVGTGISTGAWNERIFAGMLPVSNQEELQLKNCLLTSGPMNLMSSELGNIAVNLHQGDNLTESLMELFCSAVRIGLMFHIPYQAVFEEVHRSNCTKQVVEGQDPAAGLKYGVKTTKGPNYQPPNLRPLLGLGA